MTTPVNILDYVAGDSLVMAFTVLDHATGRAADLTSASARWSVAPVLSPSTLGPAVLTLTSGNGQVEISSNVITVTLPKRLFREVGDYIHELEVTLSSGVSLAVARGKFRSLQSINDADAEASVTGVSATGAVGSVTVTVS